MDKYPKDLVEDYNPLKEKIITDEKVFEDFLDQAIVVETVVKQVSDIFAEKVLNSENELVAGRLHEYIGELIIKIRKMYVNVSTDANALVEFPELDRIVEWMVIIYTDLFEQLFNKEFVDMVVVPGLDAIGLAVLEFAAEEDQEKENKGEE